MKGDLVVLVPDRNTEAAVEGLLCRHQSLRIRPLETRILVHPEKDPGCRLHGHELLRIHQRNYLRALMVFDREGCGTEEQTRVELEAEAERQLAEAGWKDRSGVIVIDPELDIWVWSGSPQVDEVIGWANRSPGLREWLKSEGFPFENGTKPLPPKEALERALRVLRKPRSSAIYKDLALRVGLEPCQDAAFAKLKSLLHQWFPVR